MDIYKKDVPFCQICSGSFDSNETCCKKCQFYNEALAYYGRTKSNEEYQMELLLAQIANLKAETRG